MLKNILIIIILIAAIAEGVYIYQKRAPVVQPTARTTPSNQRPVGPRITLLTKGMNLEKSVFAKYAHKIAPGDISDKAKTALVGFNLNMQTQTDGSILVTMTPKDSDDQHQQYTLKPGYSLYFIEQTAVDDKTDQDINLRDDYCVIVDQNGIVQ